VVEYESGLYAGRVRKPFRAEDWIPYTDKHGHVADLDGSVQFRGTLENGFRYPGQDSDLIPTRIFGLRFRPNGDLNFYAHFRATTLYFSSRFSKWEIVDKEGEYRVPIRASMLSDKWHSMFLYLPCLEERTGKSLDALKRISVRGNLQLSHVWCLEHLRDLPVQYLWDAEDLTRDILTHT